MDRNTKIGICGSGPIGNYLVIRLIELGFTNLTVFESGYQQNENTALTKKNYLFETPSMIPEGVHRLGGGGNYWFGRIGEFSQNNFQGTSSASETNWPISKADLAPHYRKVRQILNIEETSDDKLTKKIEEALSLDIPKELELQVFQWIDPLVLKKKFLKLVRNRLVNVLTGHFVDCINPVVGGGFTIFCKDSDSTHTKHEGFETIFLAAGTLQTTAIIQRSRKALGINDEKIGRKLMEHLDFFVGEVTVMKSNVETLKKLCLNRRRSLPSISKKLGVAIKPSIEIEQTLNFLHISLEVVPQTSTYYFSPRESFLIHSKLQWRQVPFLFERVFRRTIRLWRDCQYEFGFREKKYSLWLKAEELPFKNSYFTISQNNPYEYCYNHQISDETFIGVKQALAWIKDIFQQNNMGVVHYNEKLNCKENLESVAVNFHPMGTLAFGDNPNNSVCNEYLELHQQRGLFVASAAVFPSGSNANPTFTTLALVERAIVSRML